MRSSMAERHHDSVEICRFESCRIYHFYLKSVMVFYMCDENELCATCAAEEDIDDITAFICVDCQENTLELGEYYICLLYTSPSPRD